MLQERQRSGDVARAAVTDTGATPLPSLAGLLRQTPAGDGGAPDVSAQGARDEPPGTEPQPRTADPWAGVLRAAADGDGEEVPGADGAMAAKVEGLTQDMAQGREEMAQEMQESRARGVLRRALRRKLDLNLREVDWEGGGDEVRGRGWGYGGEAGRRRTLLTQAELESLLSDSSESADSL